LWDTTTGQLRRSLPGPPSLASVLAFVRDGRALLAGGMPGPTRRWDVVTGQEEPVNLPEGQLVAASPRGDLLALRRASDTALVLVEGATGEVRLRFTPQESGASRVAIAPDGGLMATWGSDDRRVKVWDALTGTLRFSWRPQSTSLA